VHPEVENVGAFVGKDNDAAEDTDAVVSSMPSINKWVKVERYKEQQDSSENERLIIGGETLFERWADDLSEEDW
jgi:hypothetical protein